MSNKNIDQIKQDALDAKNKYENASKNNDNPTKNKPKTVEERLAFLEQRMRNVEREVFDITESDEVEANYTGKWYFITKDMAEDTGDKKTIANTMRIIGKRKIRFDEKGQGLVTEAEKDKALSCGYRLVGEKK